MLVLMKKERCQAISDWVDKHRITRFLLSPISMAFAYCIFLFIYEIVILRDVVTAIHPVLIGWAGIIVAYNALIRRNILKLHGGKFLVLFSIVSLIVAVLNWRAGIVGNIKAWILTVLPIFAFTSVCQTVSEDKRKKVLIKVLLGASVVVFLASLISLSLYLIRFGGPIKLFGIERHIGLRIYNPQQLDSGVLLYGIYCDPNHAAMYSLAFAIYSLVLLLECRKGLFKAKWQNILGIIYAALNLLIQFCFFPLANSRGGWLCMIIACIIISFLYIYNGSPKKGKFLRFVISFGLALAITAGVCGLFFGARTAMAGLSDVVVNAIGSTSGDQPSTGPSINNELNEDVDYNNFNKDNDAFGAGRVDLWRDSLQLFTKRPILGQGPGNNQYYAVLYGFENMIAEDKALHNSYLDLLVDYGVFGFALLMCFWASCLITVLKRIVNKKLKTDFSYYAIGMIVVMIAGVICFLSCAFINTTAMYCIMLIMTGYLVASPEHSKDDPHGTLLSKDRLN